MTMKTTYGSLAYDLDALARERQLDDAGILPERKPQAAPQPQYRPRAKAKAKTRPSPVLVGGVTVLISMLVVLMMGYTRLTQVSASVSAIKGHISQLEAEHISLLTEYERTYDLAKVKQVAQETGMDTPTSGQIEYIDMGGGDAAVVYRDRSDDAMRQLVDRVRAGADQALEFFR